jgi:hypothetical protein
VNATALRYRVFHTAGRLVRGGRRKTLKIAASWPWAGAIITAWHRIQAFPHPTRTAKTVPAIKEGDPGARGTPGHPARQPGQQHAPVAENRLRRRPPLRSARHLSRVKDRG